MYSNQFKFDVLTIIGSGFVTDHYPFLKFLSFFKMMRIRKIGNFIESLNGTREFKALLNIIKIITYLLLFLHNYACLWWRITRARGDVKYIFDISGKYVENIDVALIIDEASGFPENVWYPPNSYLYPLDNELYDNSKVTEFYQYLLLFYSATMMLGLENEGPVNFIELVFMVLMLVIAALTYNLLFSSVSELINYLRETSIDINDYHDAIVYIDLELN
jgi:hypothetical protein